MREVSINFLALPTSKNITQDYGQKFSTVSIEDQAKLYPAGLLITGVLVDGMPVWTCPFGRAIGSPHTIAIRPPLRQQGERVEVQCLYASVEPADAPQRYQATTPAPDLGYGLQAPSRAYTSLPHWNNL